MDMLNGMQLFTEVVRANSFAGAGRKLGMVPSSVSRQINALEQTLGARLLNRSTRKLSLTEVGRLYYEKAMRVLSDLDDANLVVSELSESPRGTLRVSAPVAFGRLYLAPALSQFLTRFPELSVDLTITDQIIDMVEEGTDVAVRIGVLQDSNLVARKLASSRCVICASPIYFEHHGTPQRPEELAHHNCLTYKFVSGPVTWTFRGADGLQHVKVTGNLQVNSVDALEAAASHGTGIVLLPIWSVMSLLRSGKLKTALREYTVCYGHGETEKGIYAIHPHRQHVSPKVRAFLDFMVEYFENPHDWEIQ
jgi:DNA-binding transcriptional LysR family regulator